MKKLITWLLVLSFCLGLVACGDGGDENVVVVSEETTTAASDLYATNSATASNEKGYTLQTSFRDDNFWYFIYYLGRVTEIPVGDITANVYEYTGNTHATMEFKITEMTTERVAKSLESANTVTDGWSNEVASSMQQNLSGSVTCHKTVGISAEADGLKASAEQGMKVGVTRSLQKGFQEKYGINSTTQNTLAQYEELVKEKTVVTEKTMTFSFTPGESKVGFYNYVTLGSADVFGVVIYDPVSDRASITSVSNWVLLKDKLVYFEDESFVDHIKPDKLELKAEDLRFSMPSTYYETVTDDMLDIVPTTYQVIYHANGGTGSMPDGTFKSNAAKALAANTFRRDGYKFLGWSTTPTAKDPTYTDMQSVNVKSIANEENVVTLYAVWLKTSCEVKYLNHVNVTEKSPKTIDLGALYFEDIDLARIAKYCSTGRVNCTFQTTNGEGNDQNVDRTVTLIGLNSAKGEHVIFSRTYQKEHGTYNKNELGEAPAAYFEGGLRVKLQNYRHSWFGDNVNVQSGVKDIRITIVFE